MFLPALVSPPVQPHVLLPHRPTFTGHQTFALRTGWLKKGVDALHEVGAEVFSREDALVTLGVGKNMVQSIRHWLLTTRMARERPDARGRQLEITPLGQAIFGTGASEGWDAYLEDDATLWLLHWQLAGPGSAAFSWIWTFNELRSPDFTKKSLTEAILYSVRSRMAKPPGSETVERDVDCLLRTYVADEEGTESLDTIDCPLNTLGLIRHGDGTRHGFGIGPKPTLPAAIFFYALTEFWRWREAGASLSVHDIAYGEGGPGCVFKIDEDSIYDLLDEIEDRSAGRLRFSEEALTPQVMRGSTATSLEAFPLMFLKGHYEHV